jgi:AraC family transcriptional regulator of adaptative response/methylated-DNA-[protein]-cysteine methyltransferase
MVAGVTGGAVCLLEFADQPRVGRQLAAVARSFGRPLTPGESPELDAVRRQLGEYFAGERRSFELPLATPGTPFQRLVWDELRRIPYGETLTYAELALGLGRPGASRAVGQANGANRIAILIPCHRVVACDGGLGGYGGGLWRKLRLLETEGASPSG